MPNPLFPEKGGHLKYQQGEFGDCFVLVAVQCIYNSGQPGRQFLKSLFEEKADHILVRLPHTDQSRYLRPAEFDEKYGYYFNSRDNQDVFVIPHATLSDIDQSKHGVHSNTLALKILERLVSYYYEFNWDRRQRHGSLDAHNFEGSRHPSISTSCMFMSKVLGVAIESFDIDQIIKLKNICPEQPVYVSRKSYLSNDKRSRHAYLLQAVARNKDIPEEYDFSLINPWNSEEIERHGKADLQLRESNFVIYIVDPEFHKQLKYVLETPQLYDLICRAKHECPWFANTDFISRFSKLYQEISYLPDILSCLDTESLSYLYFQISIMLETKDEFIDTILFKFPYVGIAEIIIRNEPVYPLVYRALAGIALRTKHIGIYNYLLDRKFNFNLFVSAYPDEINSFFSHIAVLEKLNASQGILTLRRINQYIHAMVVQKIRFQDKFMSVRWGVIEQDTEKAFHKLQIEQAELVILDCVAQIRLLPVSFKECASMREVSYHREDLTHLLKKIKENALEAHYVLTKKREQQPPQIVEELRIKLLAIDEAEITQKQLLRVIPRMAYPKPFFDKQASPELFLEAQSLLPAAKKANFNNI